METWPLLRLNYGPIDRIVEEWAERNKLNLIKEFKDSDVRSVYLSDSKGSRRVQIWIDPVEADQTTINVWRIPQRGRDNKPAVRIPTTIKNLSSALDDATEMAIAWLSA